MMLTDGDPRTFTPELYARLTPIERWQVVNWYERRLYAQGRGDPRYPDDEGPMTVAKRAFLQGTFVACFFVGVTPFLFAGACAFALINSGIRNVVTVDTALVSGVVMISLLGLWALRARQILRYMASPSPVSPGDPLEQTAPTAGVTAGESVRGCQPSPHGNAPLDTPPPAAPGQNPMRHAKRVRGAILVGTLACSALIFFGANPYHGSVVVKVLYVILFGQIGQILVWKAWLASSSGRRAFPQQQAVTKNPAGPPEDPPKAE
jgi:hypothetical protein